jgi:hypothetical protein
MLRETNAFNTIRPGIPWGACLAIAAALLLPLAGLASERAVAAGQNLPVDISGVWQVTKYQKSIRTVDGKQPPMKPEALETYKRNRVAMKKLKPKEDMSRCVPPGVPRALFAPFPVMVLQTPRKITFVHEYQHLLRHIYMDEPLPDPADIDPTYMGESVGRWDGNTLVVETIGFNDKTVLDREGVPHSKAMKVTERWSLIDGGKRMENLITIDDPETFTQPWTTRLVFERKPGTTLKEYNCVLLHEEY